MKAANSGLTCPIFIRAPGSCHGLKPLVSHNAESIGPAGPGTEARVRQPRQRPGQALVAAAVRWVKARMPRQWSRPAI